MPVKKGDKIKVDYIGAFVDGSVFDSSKKHGAPLEFTAGIGAVVPGFDNAVIGMNPGDEKLIQLQPKDAYGESDLNMLKKISRAQLNVPGNVEPGMVLSISLPNGHKIPALVSQVTNEEITLDLNHPLAGKILNFKIKLVEIVQ